MGPVRCKFSKQESPAWLPPGSCFRVHIIIIIFACLHPASAYQAHSYFRAFAHVVSLPASPSPTRFSHCHFKSLLKSRPQQGDPSGLRLQSKTEAGQPAGLCSLKTQHLLSLQCSFLGCVRPHLEAPLAHSTVAIAISETRGIS